MATTARTTAPCDGPVAGAAATTGRPLQPSHGPGQEDASEQRRHRSRGKIAHLACNNCRRRRVRCVPVATVVADNGTPKCAHCIKVGSDCIYSGQDMRRETIQSLRGRLAAVQPEKSLSPTSASSAIQQPEFGNGSTAAVAPTARETDLNFDPTYASYCHWPPPKINFEVSPQRSTASTSSSIVRDAVAVGIFDDVALASLDDSVETLTCDAAGEIRSIPPLSADGLSTGSTALHNSNKKPFESREVEVLQFSPIGARVELAEEPTDFRMAAALRIQDMPMGTDIRAVDHLLHTYMCWHHSVFPILSRKAFGDGIRHGGRYYTPLLLNAILAITCHLSHWDILNATSLPGDAFFEQAKILLDKELANPSLCTVQALCLMAKREVYCGRGLRGGLYFSQAGRLVMDLGLHLDPSPLIKQGYLTPFDGYVRRVTFWGVWSVDKEFGAVLGRPGTLIDLNITCPRPPYWKDDDFHWANSVKSGTIVPLHHGDEKDGTLFVGKLNLDVSLIHEQLAKRVYRTSGVAVPREVFESVKTGLNTLDGLFPGGKMSSPESAVYETPHLLTARLFGQDQIIIFCRPFALNNTCDSSIKQQARDMCFTAAGEIVDLMETIRMAMPAGVRTTLNGHVHSLLYSAWVCLYELLPQEAAFDADRRNKAGNLLRKIIALLESMSHFRPAANQALINLRNALTRADAVKTSSGNANGQNDPPLPTAGQEDLGRYDDILSWPTDGLDAFLFSSAQYTQAEDVRPQESDNTWLSTAALFQSQGDWSAFR